MNRYSKLSLVVATLAAVAAGASYAANGGLESKVTAITKAKIPLIQAVAIAELHLKGKALEAEYKNAITGAFYEVDVVSGGKVFEVKIDADKGSMISSAEDKADDEHDAQDGND